MNYKGIFMCAVVAGALLAMPQHEVRAGGCFEDPVYELNQTAKVIIGARVRDVACMEGSVVLKTLPVGKLVHVIGSTDGWYKVEDGGVTGWVGMTLVQITDSSGWSGASVEPSAPISATATQEQSITSTIDSSLTSRLKGYILLQVQQNGEAWYVNPSTLKRYYLKDGPTAYEMMRAFGLGISNADLKKVLAGDSSLVGRLKGKILLQVEAHGEAYYINPKDGKAHYMKDGAAAYSIMRYLSLGITDSDLSKVPSAEFVPLAEAQSVSANESIQSTPTVPTATVVATPEPVISSSEIAPSAYQKGVLPAGVDLMALQVYWTSKINDLRQAKGLRLLDIDQRFIDTATEWAGYMGEHDLMTHTRPDGSSMHQWIDTKGLDFTVRYSEGGWVTNYFTENIAWGYAAADMASLTKALDETLDFYLSEADSNGPHYRTIYHPDWNSVGAGFYFGDMGGGKYKLYQAFHYGSLQH